MAKPPKEDKENMYPCEGYDVTPFGIQNTQAVVDLFYEAFGEPENKIERQKRLDEQEKLKQKLKEALEPELRDTIELELREKMNEERPRKIRGQNVSNGNAMNVSNGYALNVNNMAGNY